PEPLLRMLYTRAIDDATGVPLSAVYGGAFHPSAEGHAAMADAALPAARAILGLEAPPEVIAPPLPPPPGGAPPPAPPPPGCPPPAAVERQSQDAPRFSIRHRCHPAHRRRSAHP